MEKKKLYYIAVAACVAGIGIVWGLSGRNHTSVVDFATEKVVRATVNQYITATGTIEPVTEVEVGTQVSGIIDKIYVDYNTVVKKGQLIAEMDKVTLQSELQSARATYDGSKAEYDYQQKCYERKRILHEKQLISDTDYEEAVYSFQKARSAWEQSKAALSKAERNLSYATITSPIDGVVTSRDVEEGQTVASGFETPTLFTIAADLTKMQVVADVDEADIADVVEGARVTFTVDAYPDDVFEGTVRQVRLGSTNSSSSSSATGSTTVVTYEVVIVAENPDLKLKPRLTANATIYTLVRENVLTVSNKALRFTPHKDMVGNRNIVDCQASPKVWTLDNQTFTAHPVKTGMSDGSKTEIVSGLAENTLIVSEAIVRQPVPVAGEEAAASSGERSPFMPGPPGSNRKKSK